MELEHLDDGHLVCSYFLGFFFCFFFVVVFLFSFILLFYLAKLINKTQNTFLYLIVGHSSFMKHSKQTRLNI